MKLLILAVAAAQLAGAEDAALDLLPANTKVVFGIRVPAVVASAIFQDPGTGGLKASEEWLKMVAITGFDPLHDIDEILLASPADKEKAAALLVLRGRFDAAKMGAGAPAYHGVVMVGGSKGVLALLDANTAIAGETGAVRAAIDGRGKGVPLDAALAARVRALRERFEVWGTGERAEGFVPPTGKQQELDSVDRFEFGLRLNQGFELGAEFHTRSAKDTAKLMAAVEGLKAMLKAQQPAGPTFDIQMKDGTIRISLAVSADEVSKIIAAQDRARPANATPVIVGSEPSGAATQNGSDTRTFRLPGKQ